MLVNYQTLLIDKMSQLVIGSSTYHDAVKLVSSTIIDTLVICLPIEVITQELKDFNFKKNIINFKFRGDKDFLIIEDKIDDITIDKQRLFSLRHVAAVKLIERMNLITNSLNYITSLNIEDINLYHTYRNDLINLYSDINHVNKHESTKHLDLINESNKQLILKKYDILWRYGNSIKDISNLSSLDLWIKKFNLETQTIYKI
jgi:hypothetical protein